jgi:hypothetical protein
MEPVRPRDPNASVCPEPTDPAAATHASLPFFIFAQSFGANISHFLISLSHLTIMNSVILVTVNSLSHFNYRAKSFYDFCQSFCYSDLTHSIREFSHFSLLQYSVIFATVSVAFAIFLSHFLFCYSEFSHFYDVVSHFLLL